jgi:hypothetical protein
MLYMNKTMQFLRFRDFSTADWIYVFHVGGDDVYEYFISPSCHEWIQFLGIESWEEKVALSKVNKNFFTHEILPSFQPRMLPELCSYKVEPWEYKDLEAITDFFLHFYGGSASLSLCDRLIRSIRLTGFRMECKTLKKIVKPIADTLLKDPKIRLQILFAPELAGLLSSVDLKDNT